MSLKNTIDRYQHSVNRHLRTQPVELIVLHKIALPLVEPCLQTVCNFFCNQEIDTDCSFLRSVIGQKVSCHYVIGFDGEIVQCVEPSQYVAWHCGKSFYQGRDKCNEFSVGIEFLGFDWQDLTCSQYRSGAKLISELRKIFSIPSDNIVGHRDIAMARKTDPGLITYEKLIEEPPQTCLN